MERTPRKEREVESLRVCVQATCLAHNDVPESIYVLLFSTADNPMGTKKSRDDRLSISTAAEN